ncbi:MAG: sugar ABC transporter ATP-binding protein [Planctomycetota bacterium]|jgi:ABC-type sugar transport system ATPase subunit|nr:sugar ABC transporter ATP-binding protein [Planctomycetota bacterium]
MSEPMISFHGLIKHFPGQTALDDVSFDVAPGEIHALLGENGAGKSTLLNVFHGVLPLTSGEMLIQGKKVEFHHTKEALDYGIVKVHQEINLVPEMTVWENLFLGMESRRFGFLRKQAMIAAAGGYLAQLQCGFRPNDRAGALNVGEKQMLQIARALLINAKIISFDEPTSSLSACETATLFKIIRGLKAGGITILYISHKLDEVFELCDRATVLRDGKYINTFNVVDIDRPILIKSMVGRDVALFATRHRPSRTEMDKPVLRVENLASDANGFRSISFTLHRGEILGFFGLVGAKRTDVMRAIFGADCVSAGQLLLHGRRLVNRHPSQGVKNGIALIPENRKEQGFAANLTNADNIAMASLAKYLRGPFVSHRRKDANARRRGEMVRLNPNDPAFPTRNLSGGNAQKVVIAKWLSTEAEVMILDEPTKGIDVAAKAEIYALMEDMVEKGKSIIMVSSELPELIGMSDRIVVMRDGEIAATVDKNEFAEQKLLTYAVEGTAT